MDDRTTDFLAGVIAGIGGNLAVSLVVGMRAEADVGLSAGIGFVGLSIASFLLVRCAGLQKEYSVRLAAVFDHSDSTQAEKDERRTTLDSEIGGAIKRSAVAAAVTCLLSLAALLIV